MSYKRFVYVSDTHGDCIDPKAERAFFKFLAEYNPQIRIHGGDLWDMRPLRRGACEEEKREKLRNDFDCGIEFLSRYRPTNMLLGNHDIRLWNLARDGFGLQQEYAQNLVGEAEGVFAKLKCPVLPYDKRLGVLQIGKLKAIHGYATGPYAARRQAQAYGNVLAGHTHDIASCSIEDVTAHTCHICGCLALLDMPYNSTQIGALRHRQGWGMGVINTRTGIFHFAQVEGVNGKFVYPTGFSV